MEKLMSEKSKALIVYSSREATGNSRKLALGVKEILGEDFDICPAAEAVKFSGYSLVIFAFGVYHGWPDGDIRACMKRIFRQNVGIMMTLGAWPDSEHAHNVMGRAEGLMDSCRLAGRFICHGRLDPALIERMKARKPGDPHSWNSERAERVNAAESHPDSTDIEKAAGIFRAAWEKIKTAKAADFVERKAVLIAAFGTAQDNASAAYDNIEKHVKLANPGLPVFRAYTSGMVRRKLAASGVHIKSVAGALNELILAGFNSVKVITVQFMAGEEYHKMRRDIGAFNNSALGFKKIEITAPVLNTAESLQPLYAAVLSAIPAERKSSDAVVLMGHGNSHGRCDLSFIAAAYEFASKDPNIFLGTVEGRPDFEAVRSAMLAKGIKKAYLIPFMIVAGDHAVNDLCGDEPDSWKSRLESDGIACIGVLKGLGEVDAFAKLFAV